MHQIRQTPFQNEIYTNLLENRDMRISESDNSDEKEMIKTGDHIII